MTDGPDKKPERSPDRDKPKSHRVGQIIPRGPNKWLIRIFRGYKPNGANDYFNKTFHGTKKDAEKWLRGALARRVSDHVLCSAAHSACYVQYLII